MIKIRKSIYKFEDEKEKKKKKTFKNLGVNAIFINDLGEKLYEGCIRTLQWLISIFHYPN